MPQLTAFAWKLCSLEHLSPPKDVLEPRRRGLRVAHGAPKVSVTKAVLDQAQIAALVGQLVAGGVTQHVRMQVHADHGGALGGCSDDVVDPRSVRTSQGKLAVPSVSRWRR